MSNSDAIDCDTLPGPTQQHKLAAWLEQRYAPWYIVLLATVLLLPCLSARLVMDDHVLAVKAAAHTLLPELPSEPLSLFTFTTGDPQRNGALMDAGILLPWWTEPHHLNAFFRPLTALTHLLDFRLWPESAALMHLHSLLWFALLLAGLSHVYRTLEPEVPMLTGLALLLYAIDDAHGATVGWIANRNALVSACLALPALVAYHRVAKQGSRVSMWLGPVSFALGLAAGETAICVFGYVAAYALCLDERKWALRLRALLPYVLLLVAHRVLYQRLHLGSFGSSAYRDPLAEPLAFARMLGFNLPILLSAELFVPMADAAFWGDIKGFPALWCWAVATLAALVWLVRPLLTRDRQARFWALGMVLSAGPISASLPGERLLIVVGFGAAPLLARVLADAWHWLEQPLIAQRGAQRALVVALAVLHVGVAPFALPLRAYAFESLGKQLDRLDRGIPQGEDVTSQTVVVLNAPLDIMLSYQQISRAVRSVPRPAHLYWLSSGSSPTEVMRVAADALLVTQRDGFLLRPEETHYRASVHDLPVGTRIQRAGMQVEITASMPDGRPRSVLFRFAAPLETDRYVFRIYREGELVPWTPVFIGEHVDFPAYDFFQLMAAETLR